VTKAATAKSSARKTTATKSTATKAPAKKAAGKAATKTATKAPAKKAQATKATATKSATTKAAPTKAAATKSTATKAAANGAAKKAAPAPAKAAKKAAPEPPKRPTVGPYAKDQKFLDAQRVLLLEERAVYAGQAVDLRAEADSLALEREPGDVQFDEESGEGGTVTVDRERNLALSAQATAAVEEIDDALRKIDRKYYGGCERCFQPIPKARLQALPFARLCVACKSGGLSRR
jgi:DnaK suppressor protein